MTNIRTQPGTTPPVPDLPLIPGALALQESGICVDGKVVLDLSTGFAVPLPEGWPRTPEQVAHACDGTQPGVPTTSGGGERGALAAQQGQSAQQSQSASGRSTEREGQAGRDEQAGRPGGAEQPGLPAETGDAGRPRPPLYLRGTTLLLSELEILRDAVIDVLQQRVANPDAASARPSLPRDRFPWGIGVNPPDVLVAGGQVHGIVAYLRRAGFRARPADTQFAVSIAAELRQAEDQLEAIEAERHRAVVEAKERGGVPWARRVNISRPSPAATVSGPRRFHPAAVVGICVLLGVVLSVGLWAAARAGWGDDQITQAGAAGSESASPPGASDPARGATPDSRGDSGAATGSADGGSRPGSTDATGRERGTSANTPGPGGASPSANDGSSRPAAPGPAGQGEAWREGRIAGRATAMEPAERARIPTSAAVEGWRRVSATPDREVYQSTDEGMRVLVAAKPAPLRTQEELDAAVLRALESQPGVRLVTSSPVSYREDYPDSSTLWHVRLVDGHQVSVGCQYRHVTPERNDVCTRFAETARPERV